MIRADREGKRVLEIPFAVLEKRPPSINLFKRVPHVLKSVAKLADLGAPNAKTRRLRGPGSAGFLLFPPDVSIGGP